MTTTADHQSLQSYARLAGALSLITMAAGISAEFLVVDAVIAPGDAVTTANNILTSEPLYRLGFAAKLIDYTFYLGVTALLYGLLKPVSKSLSLLAAAFSLAGTAVVASASLYYLAPLFLLGDAPYLAAFGPDQVQALAFLSHKLRAIGSNIAMVFFGIHLLFIGWLIAKSTFLPRILGMLSAVGGICFVLNSYTHFLSPPVAAQLFPYVFLPGVLAQASLALWLLVMGVNVSRWREQGANAERNELAET
jgi:Domain of unknown function (DUF4386)